MMKKLLLAIVCAMRSASLGHADDHSGWSWALEFEGKSTNEWIGDERAEGLIAAAVPSKLKLGKLTLGRFLSGPPDPVIVHEKLVSLSACQAHNCGAKGFLWIDTEHDAGVGAIFDGEGALMVGSNGVGPKELPQRALSSMREWISEHDLAVTSAKFMGKDGKTSPLSVSDFSRSQRFEPPRGGPSFDCRKASTAIERTVCGDPRLAKADLDLAAYYDGIRRGHSTTRARAQLAQFQKDWIKRRNIDCASSRDMAECLLKTYKEQRAALGHWLPKD